MTKVLKISKVLVANRGEIALRVIRACRDLGLATVAVYSEADRRSLHVRYADEAYPIGPAPSKESYLRIDRLIAVAKKAGADAIHPGYGFLAENADFAQACLDAGLVFVGPSPEVIRTMGDKVQAKQVARQANVPRVPGTDEEVSSHEEAAQIATEFGYPVLIKASAGGGGKGMRVVRSAGEMELAFGAASREAMGAFGNGGVYVEKLLENVKHIEIQILADTFGNVIHLGERECSLQRRHQKMLEESPSIALDDDLRQQMGAVAVAAARQVGYVSAGTIEFLLTTDRKFYFIEMNTRLQVEHPVTELVTGVDVVVEQLRIAGGLPLSYSQEEIKPRGWAIECRITAEDPFNNFLPSIGRLERIVVPTGPGIRLDSAVHSGYEISLYYDPMIAKIIAWGANRNQAINRMQRALGEYKIFGSPTTIPLHQQLLAAEDFRKGDFHTTSLETNPQFKPDPTYHHDQRLIAAMAAVLAEHRRSIQSPPKVTSAGNGSAPAQSSEWKQAGRREMLRRI
ncbi:MAG: acetyl-CoA carboxylase biotin carboxylase subunit [Chloroflexota bacterium]|nr:acetyl-CoA carboxylase biotin carboxylase subunit [Chloroflexota bacterium]